MIYRTLIIILSFLVMTAPLDAQAGESSHALCETLLEFRRSLGNI